MANDIPLKTVSELRLTDPKELGKMRGVNVPNLRNLRIVLFQ